MIPGSVPAHYHPDADDAPDVAANPLISTLPTFSGKTAEDIRLLLKSWPEDHANPAVLNGTASRWQIYNELCRRQKDCFIPMAIHIELQQELNQVIRQGYRYRNPLAKLSPVEILHGIPSSDGTHMLGRRTSARRDDPAGCALFGTSGLGKTKAYRTILELYDQVIWHPEHCLTQIVYLAVDYPHDGKAKSLCAAILSEIDTLLGTDLSTEYAKSNETALLGAVVKYLHCYNVGLLILDEFQNVLTSNPTGRSSEQIFNFLVNLSNMSSVPLMFVGTPAAYDFLDQRLRVARRIGTTLDWDRVSEKSAVWKRFTDELWDWRIFDLAKSEPGSTGMPPAIRKALFRCSQGIIDIAMRVFFLSQMHANKTGKPYTVNTVFTVYTRHFKALHPIIDELKGNKPTMDDWSERYSKLLIPFDMQARLEAVKEDAAEREAPVSLAKRVIHALATKGFAPDAELRQLVDRVINENPGKSVNKLSAIIQLELDRSEKAAEETRKKERIQMQDEIHAEIEASIADSTLFAEQRR